MNLAVLVKHAFLSDFQPRITADGKDFEKQEMVYEINDWDTYALEEAIKIKEQKGGEVTAISVGKDCDDTLRTCFASGADKAIKVPYDSMDFMLIAEAISVAIKAEKFDLILAGAQSQDMNNALVGPILAGMLNIPYATNVSSVIFEDKGLRIRRELEGGFEEEDTLLLPCLLSLQTGINRPRYPSTKARITAKSRALDIREVSVKSTPSFKVKRIYTPEAKRAKMLEGSPEEVSASFIKVLKDKGVL